MKIEKIADIYEVLKGRTQKKRLVVAYANDNHSIEAVYKAVQAGLIEGILVGDTEVIYRVCEENNYDVSCLKLVQESSDVKGAARAVEMVRNGEADVLMKGLVSTDKYMHAILNKEKGLVDPNAVISHVTVMECPTYHKLLTVSDVAVIPCPDLKQKMAIIKYVTRTAGKLGVETILAKMNERGQIAGAVIEGPMALDIAIDREAAEIKKVHSPVAGDADCLVFPNLESANVFYKTCSKLLHARLGAVLAGAKVPCVLSSRGDSVDTKLNSIALAALLSE